MNLNVSLALKNKECTGHVVCPHILALMLKVESIFHKFSLKYVTILHLNLKNRGKLSVSKGF